MQGYKLVSDNLGTEGAQLAPSAIVEVSRQAQVAHDHVVVDRTGLATSWACLTNPLDDLNIAEIVPFLAQFAN